MIDVASSSATGRRNKNSNLCEALLGFVPGVTQLVEWHGQVSLRQRVIVDKLVPGGPLHQGYAHVQQGKLAFISRTFKETRTSFKIGS